MKNGEAGSRSKPGTTQSVSGGSWGSSSDSNSDTGSAGAAGFAISSNSNSITIIGDNDLTIKGRRS